jgi:DNA-binding beta-propeller fold protein YncE
MLKRPHVFCLLVLLLITNAVSGEPSFKAGPTVKKEGASALISFEVSEATDVEVAILDKSGKVIRHLAAGALGGKKIPPSPLKAGLSQSIKWDGKDDLGKPVKGTKVRVRLGLKPAFSHFIGGGPERHGGPMGLGCGPKGTLYVLYLFGGPGHHYKSMGIKAYDREGKYLHQVMPYPANLKPEEREAVKWLKLEDGSEVPLVYYAHSRVMYPETKGRHNVLVRPDGKVTFASNHFDSPTFGARRMLILGAEGSCGNDYIGPKVTKDNAGGWLLTALSPDGKTIYISGARTRKGVVPAVFKTSWDATGEPTVFVGNQTTPGKDVKALAEPRGIAVDKEGNVYVCDHLNNRVSVFSPKGKPLGQLPAQYADLVAVHPESGAVYVLTTRSNPKRASSGWNSGSNFLNKKLLKFRDYKAKVPVAELVVSKASPARPFMALDSSIKPPVVWLSGLNWGDGKIKKIVDTGDGFKDAGEPISEQTPKGSLHTGWLDLAVNRQTDEVLVGQQSDRPISVLWYDGRTGKFLGQVNFKSKMNRGKWGEVAFNWKGEMILHSTSLEKLYLFNPDGSPHSWPKLDKNEIGDIPQGFTHARGHAPTPDGGFYVAHHFKHREYKQGAVSKVSASGEIVRKEFVKLGCPIGGVKSDLAGNVYVAAHIKPQGQEVPEWFTGRVPKAQMPLYNNMYGSILKIKSSGGQVNSITDEPVLWAYHGVSPMPSRKGARCSCQVPRFDVDLYGRVWVPDAFRFSVAVLDSDANPITRFGAYGNADSGGPESKVPEPEIPLGWVHSVQVTDGTAYLADIVNNRIVAVKLGAAVQAECVLP